MIRFLAIAVMSVALWSKAVAHDGHGGGVSIIDTYRAFAAAQNARDLERAGQFFTDRPDFLWVSDGQSFWGRDQVLSRMASFQEAEVWEVSADLDAATVVDLGTNAAMMHFPLVLKIGAADAPNRLGFLVSALFRLEGQHWRIASLITTRDKNGPGGA